MSQRSEPFGRLLKAGIGSIAMCEGKTAPIIEDELGAQIGIAGPTIQRYKAGYLPPDPRTVQILAEACVRRGYLNQEWLRMFLHAARYPSADELLNRLCPAGQTPSRPPRVHENLPAPTYNQFVMRAEAYAEVLDGLCLRSPVVLITSLGGMGKTSLAREVAAQCLRDGGDAPRFDAAVWVSDKDRPGTTNLSVILDTIARTLDYPDLTTYEHEDKLREVELLLRRQRVLLVVDNFETITDGALLAWLLRLPEPSKALITTREYRREFRRGGWPVEMRGMSEAEAHTFIGQCLRLLRMEKLVADQNLLVPLIAATGGNPKAIAIALGCLKYERRPLQEVIDDLYAARGELFDDLFARAWTLLDDHGHRVLLSMPMFADSASGEALAATAGVHSFVFDRAVDQLINLALLDVQQTDVTQTPRYAIHPLVRAFASAKLLEQPAFESHARERWSDFLLRHVEQYGDNDLGEEIGGGKPGHREKLRVEIDNLRLAIAWCFQARHEHAIHMIERISTFLLDEGHSAERIRLCSQGLEAARALGLPSSEAGLLTRLGWSYLVQGALEQAREVQEQARAIAERHGLSERLVQILRDLGYTYGKWGQYDRAEQLYAESLSLAQHIGDEIGILEAKEFRARVEAARGHYAEAKHDQHELLVAYKDTHPRQLIAVLRQLGAIAITEGDLDEARVYLQNAFDMLPVYTEEHEVAQLYQCLGKLEQAAGDTRAARVAYDCALPLMIRLGMHLELAEVRAALDALSLESQDSSS